MKPPFNYFTGKSGKLILSFDNYNKTTRLPTSLFLEFLDGDYVDRKVVQIYDIELINYYVMSQTSSKQTGMPL